MFHIIGVLDMAKKSIPENREDLPSDKLYRTPTVFKGLSTKSTRNIQNMNESPLFCSRGTFL